VMTVKALRFATLHANIRPSRFLKFSISYRARVLKFSKLRVIVIALKPLLENTFTILIHPFLGFLLTLGRLVILLTNCSPVILVKARPILHALLDLIRIAYPVGSMQTSLRAIHMSSGRPWFDFKLDSAYFTWSLHEKYDNHL